MSYLLPLLCLFPLFSSFFSAPLLLVKGKRWHLDCCPASIVSSFLFFMVRGGWYKKRESEKERTSKKLLCPSFLCSFRLCSLTSTLLPFPLSSCWPSFLFLLFSFHSPCSLLHFVLSLSALPCRECKHSFIHADRHTQRWYQRGSRWKDYLLNQQETVSNSGSIVMVLSI